MDLKFTQRTRLTVLGPVVPALLAAYACALAPDAERDQQSFAISAQAQEVWVVDGMQRVRPDAPAGSALSIELFAARGEYEPLQVVVKAPSGGVRIEDVVVSDLVALGGAVIPSHNATLYREHYIYLEQGSTNRGDANPPGGRGWYPEPLIPFADPQTGRALSGARLDAVPYTLAALKNQPFWIDIFVPREAQPGRYTGAVTVKTAKGERSASIVLNVWNFELPLKPSLKSSFKLWTAGSKTANLELVKHKIMPKDTRPEWQDELMRHGLNSVSVGFWSDLDRFDCQKASPRIPRATPSASAVEQKVAQYRRELFTYGYWADEISRCLGKGVSDQARAYARALQKGGTTPLLTQAPHDEWWIDGPYIWVNMPAAFDDKGFNKQSWRAKAAGQEIWSYNSTNSGDNTPKWLIDFSPVNFRIQPGFLNQAHGVTGLLYWRVDKWTEGEEWDDLQAYGKSYPGDGLFVYPGSHVGIDGVAPGMRLKWLREGVEDYDYIELLKKTGREDLAASITRSVARHFKDWDRDVGDLYAARQQIGNKLHELGGISGRPPDARSHADRGQRSRTSGCGCALAPATQRSRGQALSCS